MSTDSGLRQRKKRRTRAALIGAAIELFETKGYDKTTVADIAAAADVAPRTFFSYFPAKEDILFADTEDRIREAVAVLRGREPGEKPDDLLMKMLHRVVGSEMVLSETFHRLAPLRLRLILDTPAIQGAALRRLLQAQLELTSRLREAYPEMGELTAAAVMGSFVGALLGVCSVMFDDLVVVEQLAKERPDEILQQVYRALEVAMGGIRAIETV